MRISKSFFPIFQDFRRLCILKGIHPREPRNRKRAQKGNMTKIQTLFHEKDIRFLLHEPITWKIRDFKVFLRKLKKATDKGNVEAAARLRENKPKYNLDHIVKERYPTFVDAIRDLEDCLCLCALYATFPKNPTTPTEMIDLCRRLVVEFMHYVIESRSLRKVFVSIKGYYYQAEIMGQTVTWVVPHKFTTTAPQNVDLKLMAIFVEFYTTMLGFVNFRLYHNLNLKYPPTLVGFGSGKDDALALEEVVDKHGKSLEKEEVDERIAALNQSLVRTVANMGGEDDVELDVIPTVDGDVEKMAEAKLEADEVRNLQNLFKGKRFFLSREVPRENLVFMIRALGGEVSWDAAVAPGGNYGEDDARVTHQVCDRPSVDMRHVSRVYVQPQWIFDSINLRREAPVQKYFVGETLPPHLSPFEAADRRIGDYVPPEEKKLLEGDEDEEEVEDEEDEEESEEDEDDEEGEEEEESEDETSKMKVEVGKPEKVNPKEEAKALEEEEFRLRKMMIKKKHKGLYRSMMKSRKRRTHESKQLERKRKQIDEKAKEEKKKNKPKAANKKAVTA